MKPTTSRFSNATLAGFYLLAFGGMPIATLAAVIFFIPSIIMTTSYRGGFLALSFLILYQGLRSRSLVWIGGWFWVALIFYGLFVLRVIYEGYANISEPTRFPPTHYLIFLFGVILIPSIAFLRPIKIPELPMVYRFLTYGMAVIMIVATYYYRDFFTEGGGRLQRAAFTGDAFGLNPLILSYMGSTTMVLALYSFFDKRLLSPFPMLQGLVVLAAGMFPFFIGASRGPVVVMLSCAIILAICRIRAGQFIKVMSFVMLFTVISITAYFSAEALGSRVFERFLATGEQIETGATGASRIDLWITTAQETARSPIFGSGLEIYGNHPHNAILEAFYATGLIGGILFVLLMGKGFICSLFLLRSRADYGWLALLFIHFLIMHMFSTAIWTGGPLLYTCFGVIATTVYLKQIRQRALHQRNQPAGIKGLPQTPPPRREQRPRVGGRMQPAH